MNQKLFKHQQIVLNVYEPVEELLNLHNIPILSSILLLQLQHDFDNRIMDRSELENLKREGFDFYVSSDNKYTFEYKCMLKRINIVFTGMVDEVDNRYKLSDWKTDCYEICPDFEDKKESVVKEKSKEDAKEEKNIEHSERQTLLTEEKPVQVESPSDKLAKSVMDAYERRKKEFHRIAMNGISRFTKNHFSIQSPEQANSQNNLYSIVYISGRYAIKGKKGTGDMFRHPLAAKLSIIFYVVNDKDSLQVLRRIDETDEFDSAIQQEVKKRFSQRYDDVDADLFGLIDDIDINEIIRSLNDLSKMYGC